MSNPWAAKGWMTTEVAGLKEIDRMLSVLPDDVADKVLRGAVSAGAAVVKREARRLCPKRSGKTAKSIRIKYKRIGRGSRRGRVFYQVGPSNGLGHLIEFGTTAHIIKPSLSRRIKRKVRGESVSEYWGLGYMGRFGKKVNHPGATPQPFMRPAFDENQSEIIKAMRVRLMTGIERAARKRARANIAARRAARKG